MAAVTRHLNIFACCAALAATACSGPGGADGAGAAPERPAGAPAELIAPLALEYTVVGTPVVGQPVGVSVGVTAAQSEQPIVLRYRSAEPGSMTFPESQAASATLAPQADGNTRRQQFSLIPQREGRIFVIVSATVETSEGAAIKSMSIPIEVARAAGAAPAADEGEQS